MAETYGFVIGAILFFIHIGFGLIYYYLTWHHDFWSKKGVPTARPLTLLGTYPNVLTGKRNLVYDIQDVYDKYKAKYRAVGVFLTRQPQLLVLEPQLANEVLVKNFSNFRDSLTSSFVKAEGKDKIVGRNPFWAGGDYWKNQRADAQGGVTPNKLKQAYTIWQNSGKKLINFIAQQNSNIIKTRDLCYRLTADIMFDFIWGIDAATLTANRDNEPNQLLETTKAWTTYGFKQLTRYFATLVAPAARTILGHRFYPQATDEFFTKLTRDALELRRQTPALQTRADYLNHLRQLREQKGLSHDDLVGHALTVLLDGFETTAAALLHTIYYLSDSPEIQQKLRSEILSNVDIDGSITFESLTALRFLEQCIYESLRLASLIPHYSRICTKATTVEVSAGQTVNIEPGTLIMVPAYQFHHDEMYFPDAEQFRPERFDDGAHHELNKQGVLLPFGDGPRICLGMRVGLLTLKMSLAQLISHYEIVRTSEQVPIDDTSFVITLGGDVNLEYRKLKD